MNATAGLTRRRRITPLSLTPLIDVVFILLMFFMLTSSFIDLRNIDLATPTAVRDRQPPPPQEVLLTADARLLSLPGLTPFSAPVPAAPVVVRPAPAATVQQIVDALTGLKAMGIPRVNLGQPYEHGPSEHGPSEHGPYEHSGVSP